MKKSPRLWMAQTSASGVSVLVPVAPESTLLHGPGLLMKWLSLRRCCRSSLVFIKLFEVLLDLYTVPYLVPRGAPRPHPSPHAEAKGVASRLSLSLRAWLQVIVVPSLEFQGWSLVPRPFTSCQRGQEKRENHHTSRNQTKPMTS